MSISKSLKALAIGGALGVFVASFGFSMSIAMGLFEVHMPTKEIKTSDVIIAQNYIDEQVTETRIEVAMYGDSSTKSYMDYRCITNTASKQWNYIYNSGEITVCNDGFLRTTDGDYYGVALGSYFGEIGSKYVFTLDSGVELKVVKLDEKADKDTCENNYKHKIDGSIIEFVVDSSKMDYAKGSNGYIYNGNFNNNHWLEGNITKIEKVID